MSLSQSGMTGYDDLIHQNFALELFIGDNTDDQKLILEGEFPIEPADGVDRGELYELVWLESSWRAAPPDAVNEMSNMAYRSELSFRPEMSNHIDTVDSGTETFTKQGGNTVDVDLIGSRTAQLDDDLLWWTNDRVESGFENSTDGAGGNATDTSLKYWSMNFRDQFGQGPVVDRHDLLYWNLVTNERFTANNYAYHQQFRFIWDMIEDDASRR